MGDFQTQTLTEEDGTVTESSCTRRRATRFINVKPASNLHHAIRIARAIELPLNLFVSIHFKFSDCPPEQVSEAFQRLREKFGKWVTRPPAKHRKHRVPPTFVWVLECPTTDHPHCHWLLHVPKQRQTEFQNRLPKWLSIIAGRISNEQAAIDIKPAHEPCGAGRYMLKGMEPYAASCFDIRPEPQGEIYGRRSGFSRNLGPTQKSLLRARNAYPPARRYRKGLFKR